MYILLAIVGEIASIAGTTLIAVSMGSDMLFEAAKRGYKIDSQKAKEYKEANEGKIEISKGKQVLNRIVFFTPGVNLICYGIQKIQYKKELVKDPDFEKVIVPMTEEEKKTYASLKTKKEKLVYLIFLSEKENENEQLVAMSGNRIIVTDMDLLTLNHERLTPLAYTFDEVKELNSVTGHSYRIGKVEDSHIAIIGIHNPDYEFKRVKFASEKDRKYDFIPITEEEAINSKFLVYATDSVNMKDINNAIDVIREKRNNHLPRIEVKQSTKEETPKLVLKIKN